MTNAQTPTITSYWLQQGTQRIEFAVTKFENASRLADTVEIVQWNIGDTDNDWISTIEGSSEFRVDGRVYLAGYGYFYNLESGRDLWKYLVEKGWSKPK